jgi:hypothetical protein
MVHARALEFVLRASFDIRFSTFVIHQLMPLDFRKNTPPPLISPREMVRIVMLLALMVLVLFAMNFLGRPSAWEWMLPGDAEQPVAGPLAEPGATVVSEPVQPQERAKDEQFTVPSAETMQESESAPAAVAEPADVPAGAFRLDRSRLSAVKDNTRLRLRGNEEAEPYYYVLDFASRIDPAQLESRGRRDLTFAQFLTAPADYRGELVHLHGAVKRLIQYEAGPNDYGIEQLYEAWLFTEDSFNNPYVVICTHIPEAMPMGEVSERVRVAGFFFKNNAYNAGDVPRVAPMILAHRLVWLRPPPESAGPGPGKMFPWLVGMSLLAAGALIFWLHRRRPPSPAERLAASSTDSLDAINQTESTASPEKFLDELSRDDPNPHSENDSA